MLFKIINEMVDIKKRREKTERSEIVLLPPWQQSVRYGRVMNINLSYIMVTRTAGYSHAVAEA